MTAPKAELVLRPQQEMVARDGEWSVAQIIDQTRKIKECMNAVMIKDEHYGVIPGCKKPSLWKPGAEKLCLMFRLDPEYDVEAKVETPTLISFTIRCTLNHIVSGARIASGLGSCNSREEKYRRPAPKLCPECNKPTIIKGKEEYGGGWLCYKKKDGCGAKFADGDQAIEDQSSGVADPSDLHNTILKMACKRALIAAVLNGTAASDCFAQDLEDLPEQFLQREAAPPPTQPPAPGVPPRRANGPGNWPKPEYVPPAVRDGRALDDQYARTVNGSAPSDLEVDLQRSIDANLVEVINPKTGEVTKEVKASAAQLKKIRAMAKQVGVDDEALHAGLWKYYKVKSTTLLTKAQATDAIERFQKTIDTAVNAGAIDDPGDVPEHMREPGSDDE
jgi:hypothetical protein